MIIDEPALTNKERLNLASIAVEQGKTPIVYVQRAAIIRDPDDNRDAARSVVVSMLMTRGHTLEGASILAAGVSVEFDEEVEA